ncbi:hypothetical protein [Pseudoalteromonas luteoviolacea]|uniref:hypothetical protein n=1 Tax=Pseudoalteromonas luteoviolacea TaxID=43657 RepID=UPI000A7D8957|nr:hypothetical protein [Pseudoalteromonas luteoviolacea]
MSKVWGVMEHFYQYFHHVPVDWKSELRPLLNACLTQDGQKIGDALKYSLTKLQDNHFTLYSTDIPSEFHGPDVSFELVDDEPILVYKGDSVAGLEIGDELIAVDGRSIDTPIEEKIPYSLISTHVAKSVILGSQVRSKAQATDSVTIDIKNKDNQLSSIQLPTDKYIFNSFYNGVDRYIHASQPTYQVLENNIHYINLSKTTLKIFPG